MEYQCKTTNEGFGYVKDKALIVMAICERIIKDCEYEDTHDLKKAVDQLMTNSARVSLGYHAMNYFPENVTFTVKE